MGDAATLVLAGIFGAMVGSFLNVVIHRMPRRESIILPGSHCPSCTTPIRWFDNLPILSWLVLRGRCRSCGVWISLRYPLIEALTSGLTLFVAGRFLLGAGGPDWARFGAVEYLTVALVAVTFIDFDHRIIPDRITKPGMVLAPILSILAPSLHQTHWIPSLSPAMASLLLSLMGMAAGSGVIMLMGVVGKAVFKKDAMGFGDVKFMAMVGGFVGPVGVLLVILLGCVAGSVVGVLSWLVTRSHYIPFGPFLSLGTLAVLFLRPEIVHFITVTYPSMFR